MPTKNYGRITSLAELEHFFDRLSAGNDPIGFDIETGYLGPDALHASVHPETAVIVGFSFTDSPAWARYVPLRHDFGDNLDERAVARLLWPLLATGRGVAHNAKFELRHLSRWFRQLLADDPDHGDAVRASNGYFPIRADSQVEAYLAAERPKFGLKYLVAELFGHQMTEIYELFEDLPKNKHKMLRFNILELTPRVIEYACEDAAWCLALHQRYADLPQRYPLLYAVEHAIVAEVVPTMEDVGVRYDWTYMRRAADTVRTFTDKFNAEIMADLSTLVGQPVAINLGSPKQVGELLFDKLGLRTTVYTTTTRNLPAAQRKMSTGKIALTALAKQHPVVKAITEWKELKKLAGTYLDKYEELFGYADDGHTHPNHMSAVVITGRFAVSDPPYQQSPKKYHFDLAAARAAHEAGDEPPPGTCFRFNFRNCVVAPPEHYMIGFDLSQAELRAIAGEAQEPALLQAFADGVDVHKMTAALMLGVAFDQVTPAQRDIGKTLNFALLYGMSVKGLADRLGIPVDQAQKLLDAYFSAFSNIATWQEKQRAHAKEHGYVVSAFGRKLPIWEYQSDNEKIRAKGDRACVNYPIQGSATGDYMKIAMVRAHRALKDAGLADKVHLVMNVHDALEFYAHRSVDPGYLIALLQPAVIFDVPNWPPMRADWHIAARWGDPRDIDITPDGRIQAKTAGTVIDLTPTVEEDEETGEQVVDFGDDLNPDDVRQALQPIQPQPRVLVITLTDMPTVDTYRAFLALLGSRPGPNTVLLVTPEGELDLDTPTDLGLDDLATISTILGPVTLRYGGCDYEVLAAALTE